MVVHRIVTLGALGGFVFMALIGWMLALDVASIATLMVDSVNKDTLKGLIVGGAITKGVVAGAALGMASLAWGASRPRMTRA